MTKRIDLSGKSFGLWTVLSYAGGTAWVCRCACGSEKSVAGDSLRRGLSTNCRKGHLLPAKHRPTREARGVVEYRCGRCHEFFPRAGFHPTKRTVLGIRAECRRCHSAVVVSSRDLDLSRAAHRRSEAQRRAQKAGAGGRVSAADWRAVIDILGGACLCCGSSDKPTQDHVVPLSKGGPHHPRNLQPLCRRCNERKQARTFDYRTTTQIAAIQVRWPDPALLERAA